MKILVTGGNGFIGSNFIDFVINNREVELVVNIDSMTGVAGTWIDSKYGNDIMYRKVTGDICEIGCYPELEQKFDLCVHFAAESHVDNSINDVAPFIKTNIQGTLAVATFCDKHKIPMIHVSTDEVYGHLESLDDLKFTSESLLEPRNPYAASKAAAELMLKAYANCSRTFEYYIIRPSNNYGPHQDPTKFLPKLMKHLYTGELFPMYGTGDFYREWTWVIDTAKAIMKLYDAVPLKNGTATNVSSNEIISNFDMAMKVCNAMRFAKEDTVANISFIKDPRGNAHDKIYSIKDDFGLDYVKLDDGILDMVSEFMNSDNGAT